MLPVKPITGTNTAISTSEVAITAPPNSAIAWRAASSGAIPRSSRRPMSSLTTIASSTTRPLASTIPNRVRLFSDWPLINNTLKAPTRATGTARAVTRARRLLPRPSNNTSSTSSTASRRLSMAPSMLPRTKSASSRISS